jgi:outer membrane protein OmpA-like peptidoglycan-associated protein
MLMSGCASMPPPAAVTSCQEANLSIYFSDNSAELTPQARAVIADAGKQAGQCRVREVDVTGLADYRGPPDANLALSRARAQSVALALEKVGLPEPRFVKAEGEAGAIASPGVAEPMRREVKVIIRFGQ